MAVSLDYKFKIVRCGGEPLVRDQIVKILEQLPFHFYLTEEDAHTESREVGQMEVYYCGAQVITLHPPKGTRLSCATVTNPDFPLRPDNIMDESHLYPSQLRCCFHPKLSTFGIPPLDNFADEVEIDIHKYSWDRSTKGS